MGKMANMEAGEIWYQRSRKLADYFKNEGNPPIKRVRAFIFFQILVNRLVAVANAENIKCQPKTYTFARGGVLHKNSNEYSLHGEEFIVKNPPFVYRGGII